MARSTWTTLAPMWANSMVDRLSEAERFALIGVSIGMRCNIDQWELLLPYLDGELKPNWVLLHKELLALDKGNADEEGRAAAIWLQGSNLNAAQLEGADLSDARLEGADLTDAQLKGADLAEAHLEGARLYKADLKGACLYNARLHGADISEAHLEDANLFCARLKGAKLAHAHLERAALLYATLEGADLHHAHLANADFMEADLRNAVLCRADVRGASLREVRLQGADLSYLGTDGMTLIDPAGDGQHYAVDRETYSGGVALANIRISPGVRQLLEYNVRRERWLRWCGGRRGERGDVQRSRRRHWAYKWPVWLFWQMSDYGKSTWRIAAWFGVLSVLFAMAYRSAPSLVVCSDGKPLAGLWHAIYFSVVTMTTLGFGDIHASRGSALGQLVLMLQVILGYVLLGALVCRLAILFQAGGPAGKFAKLRKVEPESPEKALRYVDGIAREVVTRMTRDLSAASVASRQVGD